MAMLDSRSPVHEVIEIRDRTLDVAAYYQQMEASMASRSVLPPLPDDAVREGRIEARLELYRAVDALRAAAHHYGAVETVRTGWQGRLDLFFKKVVRKLIKRHIVQQRAVHDALIDTLDRLVLVMEVQERQLRQRPEVSGWPAVERDGGPTGDVLHSNRQIR